MREVGAQLDAVGPTLGSCKGGVQRLDGRLDENGQVRVFRPVRRSM